MFDSIIAKLLRQCVLNQFVLTVNLNVHHWTVKIIICFIEFRHTILVFCFIFMQFFYFITKDITKFAKLVPWAWWRHQMGTFSALLAICAGNSPVPDESPTQRPVTRSFDVFFDLRLNKRLSKHWWGWWFETLSRPLWRHRYGLG